MGVIDVLFSVVAVSGADIVLWLFRNVGYRSGFKN
jgi:hypothetical protein